MPEIKNKRLDVCYERLDVKIVLVGGNSKQSWKRQYPGSLSFSLVDGFSGFSHIQLTKMKMGIAK